MCLQKVNGDEKKETEMEVDEPNNSKFYHI